MKRTVRVLTLSTLLLGAFASSAFAHHCTVADKPVGSGSGLTVDFTTGGNMTGIKESGKSDNLHISGAFATLIFPGPDGAESVDVFIRGPVHRDFLPVQGTGMMNDQSTTNGSPDHGVMYLK